MYNLYNTNHYWLKNIESNLLGVYSKSNQEKLRSSIKKYNECDVTYDILPLTEESLTWFVPLYNNMLYSKENPYMHNISSSTINKTGSNREYFILVVSHKNTRVGGTVFSVRDSYLSIAYRAYLNTWSDGLKLRSNPSLLSDYFLAQHALKLKKTSVCHGLDRNPYGPNSQIGLAAFKLSIGCRAFVNKESLNLNKFHLESIETDSLFLHAPSTGNKISNATLFVKQENQEKYKQVTKYSEALAVDIQVID